MTLKELRLQKQLTQEEAAGLLKISRKTYIRYENGAIKEDSFKYQYVMKTLETVNFIDEEHGVLTIEQIKRVSQEVFKKYSDCEDDDLYDVSDEEMNYGNEDLDDEDSWDFCNSNSYFKSRIAKRIK